MNCLSIIITAFFLPEFQFVDGHTRIEIATGQPVLRIVTDLGFLLWIIAPLLRRWISNQQSGQFLWFPSCYRIKPRNKNSEIVFFIFGLVCCVLISNLNIAFPQNAPCADLIMFRFSSTQLSRYQVHGWNSSFSSVIF